MNRRLLLGICALAVAVLLAGCSASSNAATSTTSSPGTSSTASSTPPASSPPSSSTTTSSTLPASAVSVVKAPVLVAHTSDGSVGYRVVGAGPPLVLIMGYSGSMDSWEPSFVNALGRAHRVVIFDNAGIGRTSALPGQLTVTKMANQTAALIEALHLGRPDVLGWSMGGMIAQALAVLHPSLVRHLVLCATLPGNGKATDPSAAAASQLADRSKASNILDLLFPANQPKAAKVFLAQIIQFPHFYIASPAVDKLQLGVLGLWLTGKDAAGLRINQISAPTLVADGLDDLLVPTANDRELTSVIKGAKLQLYPDAGHGFLFQDEPQFLAVLEGFLAR